jgi:hypothetical protein
MPNGWPLGRRHDGLFFRPIKGPAVTSPFQSPLERQAAPAAPVHVVAGADHFIASIALRWLRSAGKVSEA